MIVEIRCFRGWPGRVVRMKESYEIKVSELIKAVCKTEYEEKL